MRHENKVVIVTGSSRGIGKAIALEFSKLGASIVLNGRDKSRLKESELDVLQHSKRVISICSDVSEEFGAKLLIDGAIKEFGKIDILINNVGVSSRGNLADLSPKVVQKVFESNVYGTVFPSIFAIPFIRKTKGSIVFISSVAGIRGLPGLSPYSASKMALRAFVESLRIEERNAIHVGLLMVGITEIVHNKEAIGFDGIPQILAQRNYKNVLSLNDVAQATIRMIEKRKFKITLSKVGKINAFLQSRCPLFVEKFIIRNIHKFAEKNQ